MHWEMDKYSEEEDGKRAILPKKPWKLCLLKQSCEMLCTYPRYDMLSYMTPLVPLHIFSRKTNNGDDPRHFLLR